MKHMKRMQQIGLVIAGLSFLSLGFFWGGPGFVASKLGAVATYGPYISLIFLVVGIVVLVVGGSRKDEK